MREYPMPMPFGWFQVAWSDEVAAGQGVPLFYFDRHLVAWRGRGRRGPRLGRLLPPHGRPPGRALPGGGLRAGLPAAQLALRRRRHAASTSPTRTAINKQATVRTYPVAERNGALFAWYHPTDEPPGWDLPELAEFGDGRRLLRGVPQALPAGLPLAGDRRDPGRRGPHPGPPDRLPDRPQRRRPARAADHAPGRLLRHRRPGRQHPHHPGLPHAQGGRPRAGSTPTCGAPASPPPGSPAWSTRCCWAAPHPSRAARCELRFSFVVRKTGDAAGTSSLGRGLHRGDPRAHRRGRRDVGGEGLRAQAPRWPTATARSCSTAAGASSSTPRAWTAPRRCGCRHRPTSPA